MDLRDCSLERRLHLSVLAPAMAQTCRVAPAPFYAVCTDVKYMPIVLHDPVLLPGVNPGVQGGVQ